MSQSKPNILFWPHVPYRAQYFLRYVWPATRLMRNGYQVKVIDPRYAQFWDEEMMAKDFLWADIIVLFIPKSLVGPRLLEMCIEQKKKLIVDTDDNTFLVDKSNISYEHSGLEPVHGLWDAGIQFRPDKVLERQGFLMKTLSLCDALTVTQVELAKAHEHLLARGDIYTLPNSLDLSYYKPWERRYDGIRIGWQGSASHVRDMKIIEEPLQEIQKKHNVQLVFFGQSWPDQRKLFPDAEFHPWVDQDTFHVKLGSLDIDIGLCPIEDTDFNRGKSNLKMLEYGAFGIPSICSKIRQGPYNLPDGVELEDRVLVENGPNYWLEALDALIKDEEHRRHIGENARNTVTELYNIDTNWRYWADCYEEVHNRVVEKAV